MATFQAAIIGCGEIGRRVARQWLAQDLTSSKPCLAVSRSDASADQNQQLGLVACTLDFDATDNLPLKLPSVTQLFYFVPPPSSGQHDPRLSRCLRALPTPPERIVMISTTGVYGDCQGRWIDESTPTPAPTDRAKRRLNAEQQLQRWAAEQGTEWLILRVPGIYAPDRLPIERVKQSVALVQRDEAPWTNRIHADDLANVCVRAMLEAAKNAVVNVCDDAPSTMSDYFQAVARYAGLPVLPERSLAELLPGMSLGMQSYMRESRRVRNDRMKQLWGNDCLRYPDLASGLANTEA